MAEVGKRNVSGDFVMRTGGIKPDSVFPAVLFGRLCWKELIFL
jgi:hypothetical protein